MAGAQVLAKKFDGPRAVRPAEIPSLVRLLNSSFKLPVPLEREQPHIYGRIAEFPCRHRVLVHGGRVVSHVGVFPLRYVTPHGSAVAGGIGGVCTDPGFRGKGCMSALLGESREWMRAQGMPLSILWGSRYRYARFGWEPAGRRLSVGLTGESVPFLKRFRCRVVRLMRPGDRSAELHAIHRRMPFRVDRDPATFRIMLGRAGRRVYAAYDGRRLAAYAVVNCLWWPRKMKPGDRWWNIEETAGSEGGIMGLLHWFLARPGGWSSRIDWPLGHRPVPGPLVEAMDSWRSGVGFLGQVLVQDAPGLLRGLGAGRLVPAVRRLRLGEREAARLLLGPLTPAENLPRRPAPGLAARLPLDLFMWQSDNV